MKIEPCTINPLEVILDIIPTELTTLTNAMVDGLILAFLIGGIRCENPHELVSCLRIFAEMNIVEIVDEEKTLKLRKLI